MGGVLGALFGGGQQTSGTTTPDRTTQDLNRTRLLEYQKLLDQGGGVGQFAAPGGNMYVPTAASNMLLNQANSDYVGGGRGGPNLNTNFRTGDINTAFNTDYGVGNISSGFDVNYKPNLAGLRSPESNLLSLEDFRRNTGDVTSNYINRIATPQIKAALAAQGMAGSGALPEAIANATAQQAAQFAAMEPQLLQQNAGVRLGEAENARANAGVGLQAQQLYNEAVGAANNAQLQRAQLLEGENQARLAQNQAALQRGQLFGLENEAVANQAMLPSQIRSLDAQSNLVNANRANTLFSLADQSRALEEQDFLRRMGLATTAYTGLPYQPGSTQTGSQGSQPLFNWFGQGSLGGALKGGGLFG